MREFRNALLMALYHILKRRTGPKRVADERMLFARIAVDVKDRRRSTRLAGSRKVHLELLLDD